MSSNDVDDREFRGPIEDGPWPQTIPAHVVRPGPWPTVHGYDVFRDLAAHYDWGEVVLTALGGEAPSEDAGRAFTAALTFLAPATIGHAPAHVGRLARTCGSRRASAAAVTAIAAAEEASWIVEQALPLARWLDSGEGERPDSPRPPAPTEVLDALARALPPSWRETAKALRGLDLHTACVRVLYRCGLTDADDLVDVVMLARLPASLAEARRIGRRFRDYPMDRPRFRYVEDSQ